MSFRWLSTNEKVESNIALVNPILRGNSLYAIVDGPSWTEAEANGEAGWLSSEHGNSHENNFILKTLDAQSIPIG